jgi:hypothetical protein
MHTSGSTTDSNFKVPELASTVDTTSSNNIIDESESNEINVDLMNTLDTISDTIDNISDTIDNISDTIDDITDHTADADITGSCIGSPPATEDLYTYLENRILAIDPLTTMAHGKLDYHTHLRPKYTPPDKDGGFGKTLYRRPPLTDDGEAEELGLVFFGEICSSVYGTAITAKGNHYAGTADYPKACYSPMTITNNFQTFISANHRHHDCKRYSRLMSIDICTFQQFSKCGFPKPMCWTRGDSH